jgi:hypothetical protein
VEIPTRIDPSTCYRYPFAEAFFDEPSLQPYVHDCVVTVVIGRRRVSFAVFFKNHVRLQPNNSFPIKSGLLIRGDLVVMRVGVHVPYVNFRGGDALLSDWVVNK